MGGDKIKANAYFSNFNKIFAKTERLCNYMCNYLYIIRVLSSSYDWYVDSLDYHT